MILKGADILGAKIISENNGKEIEDVDDIIYDPMQQRVIALVLKNGSIFSGMVVMLKDISHLKQHEIFIPSEKVVKRAEEAIKPTASTPGEEPFLAKTKVITKDGEELGTIIDVYFDTITGEVKDFAIEHVTKEHTTEHTNIEVKDIEKVGVDVVIAKEHTHPSPNPPKEEKTSFLSSFLKFLLGLGK